MVKHAFRVPPFPSTTTGEETKTARSRPAPTSSSAKSLCRSTADRPVKDAPAGLKMRPAKLIKHSLVTCGPLPLLVKGPFKGRARRSSFTGNFRMRRSRPAGRSLQTYDLPALGGLTHAAYNRTARSRFWWNAGNPVFLDGRKGRRLSAVDKYFGITSGSHAPEAAFVAPILPFNAVSSIGTAGAASTITLKARKKCWEIWSG